jgi:catechol 2,3-dioxygenase-like lactoylglutathione lyase family enzyme
MAGEAPSPSTSIPPFHLALPVSDIEASRSFYCGVLGCTEGRSSARWVGPQGSPARYCPLDRTWQGNRSRM